jgi:hypothetical protein
MVPIDFHHAGLPPKPPKRASATEWEIDKELRTQKHIHRVGFQRLAALRQQMDQHGSAQRGLVVGVDGRFTNRTFFTRVPQRTVSHHR